MEPAFSIPEDYHGAFRRLLPHVAPALRTDEEVLQSLLLYLKLGNERLARIAVDAYNETHRLKELANQKRLREEALIRENLEQEDDGIEDEEEDEEASDY